MVSLRLVSDWSVKMTVSHWPVRPLIGRTKEVIWLDRNLFKFIIHFSMVGMSNNVICQLLIRKGSNESYHMTHIRYEWYESYDSRFGLIGANQKVPPLYRILPNSPTIIISGLPGLVTQMTHKPWVIMSHQFYRMLRWLFYLLHGFFIGFIGFSICFRVSC